MCRIRIAGHGLPGRLPVRDANHLWFPSLPLSGLPDYGPGAQITNRTALAFHPVILYRRRKLHARNLHGCLLIPGHFVKNRLIKSGDQSFADMYQAEDRINKLITYASILAIIISILGLIALTMQSIQKKIHEIGIRKVLGANVGQIVRMFINDLTKWVFIATIPLFTN